MIYTVYLTVKLTIDLRVIILLVYEPKDLLVCTKSAR
jgi:hypothetical protein